MRHLVSLKSVFKSPLQGVNENGERVCNFVLLHTCPQVDAALALCSQHRDLSLVSPWGRKPFSRPVIRLHSFSLLVGFQQKAAGQSTSLGVRL